MSSTNQILLTMSLLVFVSGNAPDERVCEQLKPRPRCPPTKSTIEEPTTRKGSTSVMLEPTVLGVTTVMADQTTTKEESTVSSTSESSTPPQTTKKAKKACELCPKGVKTMVLSHKDDKGPKEGHVRIEHGDFAFYCPKEVKESMTEAEWKVHVAALKEQLQKAVADIEKKMGSNWGWIDDKAQPIVIQLSLCMTDAELKKLTDKIQEEAVGILGIDYKKVAEILLQSDWAKKNPELAKEMADILKGI